MTAMDDIDSNSSQSALNYATPLPADNFPLNARFAVAIFALLATAAGLIVFTLCLVSASGGLFAMEDDGGHPPLPVDWAGFLYGALFYVPLLAGGVGGLIWAANAENAATEAERLQRINS